MSVGVGSSVCRPHREFLCMNAVVSVAVVSECDICLLRAYREFLCMKANAGVMTRLSGQLESGQNATSVCGARTENFSV